MECYFWHSHSDIISHLYTHTLSETVKASKKLSNTYTHISPNSDRRISFITTVHYVRGKKSNSHQTVETTNDGKWMKGRERFECDWVHMFNEMHSTRVYEKVNQKNVTPLKMIGIILWLPDISPFCGGEWMCTKTKARSIRVIIEEP